MMNDTLQLEELIGRLVRQSWGYRNLTGQDAAPMAWTPTLTAATPGDLAVGYTNRVGIATQIGINIFYDFDITTSSFTHTTAAGALSVTGLPFASLDDTNPRFIGKLEWAGMGVTLAAYTEINCRVTGGASTSIGFVASGNLQPLNIVAITDLPTGGSVRLRGSGRYCIQKA